MDNKRQHFVPRHYLRQFRIGETEQVVAAKVDPYQFISAASIKGQCQDDNFYGKDGELDDMMKAAEEHFAPILVRICDEKRFTDKQLSTLQLMAVIMHGRTRKAAEAAKAFPRRMAYAGAGEGAGRAVCDKVGASVGGKAMAGVTERI